MRKRNNIWIIWWIGFTLSPLLGIVYIRFLMKFNEWLRELIG